MKKFTVFAAVAALAVTLALVGCGGSAGSSAASSASDSPETSESAASAAASIKDDPEEAKYQIEQAMQALMEESYGDKVNDMRITSVKVYSVAEEQADELLKSYNLGDDEVAFTVDYELHPAEGADPNEFTAGTGEYDKESGWVVNKSNVGILRPNAGGTPAYKITDFGTGF